MTDYLIGNQEEMYQWAYRLTRNYDDAQDLLQSTLLCALKSVGMYTEENNISGWLYTIMRNIFFNTTRHSGRCCCMEKEDIERMMQLGENALNDNAEIAFDMSDIQRAIDTLDRPYKIPMSLYLSVGVQVSGDCREDGDSAGYGKKSHTCESSAVTRDVERF